MKLENIQYPQYIVITVYKNTFNALSSMKTFKIHIYM